jgi:hypothetical protein
MLPCSCLANISEQYWRGSQFSEKAFKKTRSIEGAKAEATSERPPYLAFAVAQLRCVRIVATNFAAFPFLLDANVKDVNQPEALIQMRWLILPRGAVLAHH